MNIKPNEIDRYMDLLAGNLQQIAHRTVEAGKEKLYYKATSRDWSARDILAHLRSCADVWGISIEAMLAGENPILPDVHPRQWIRKTDYLELRFEDLLNALTQQRDTLLSLLSKISLEDWSRSALIGGRKHTVFSQVRRMAIHEAKHVDQIDALLRK